MHKWIQSTLLTTVAIFTLSSFSATFGYTTDLFTYKKSKVLGPGTTLTTTEKMTDQGWFRIHTIKADLTAEGTQSTVLIPRAISRKIPLTKLAQTEPNVVAAINGDFFDTQGRSTLGIIVKDGDYITSSIHDNRFYNYLKLKDGRAYIAKIIGGSTKLNNQNFSLDITYKNKPYLQFDRAILFDKHWGDESFGNTASEPIVEIIVEKNTVQDIRYNQPPVAIPENGYVVSAVGKALTDVRSHFQIGDKVTLSGDDFLQNIDQAIGGGAQILKDGQPQTDFSLDISGRHPRSALGFSKDNNTLFLMTVDGRHKNFRGMTQTELAYLMAEAGAYNGINLDGGGSSEMVVRSFEHLGFDIVNTPSDGKERPIHNGIGILNTAPTGPLARLTLTPNRKKYFPNTPISVDIQGFDQNGQPVAIKKEDISLELSGLAYEKNEGGIFPLSSGDATLTAKAKDIVASAEISVLNQPVRIFTQPESLRLKPGDTAELSLFGIDEKGFSAPIPFSQATKEISGLEGGFDGNHFVSSSPGQGIVKVSINGVSTQLPIGVGESEIPIYDFEGEKGHFVAYPPSVKGTYQETDFSHTGNSGGILRYDFVADTSTRAAYVSFEDEPIPLPEGSSTLKLWVYGDYGNGHWLRGKIRDTEGKSHTIDFEKNVDWTGWKEVSAQIPNSIQAVSLDRIYLVETDPNRQTKGVVAFDDLTALCTIAPPKILSSSDFPSFSKMEDSQFDLNIHWMSNSIKNDDVSEKEAFPFSSALSSNFKFLRQTRSVSVSYNGSKLDGHFLKNANGFLSRTNTETGWPALLSKSTGSNSKQIVLALEASPWFKNALDARLFNDILESFQSKGHTVILIYPDKQNALSQKDGVWHIRYNQNESGFLGVDTEGGKLRGDLRLH